MLQNVVLRCVFYVSEMHKTHSTLSEKRNVFDTFRVDFSQMAPEVSLNDMFYKVFLSTFPVASKRCFTKGFVMFCKVVKHHRLLVKNLMLF